jgi:putative flavoprotein involved in K+ transport
MTVVVIGGGQAGLAVSRELGKQSVEHVVLEASRVASSWRRRWDSFTLVTPNWTMDLPGAPYDGRDPEGHVHRDEIVAYLEKYVAEHAGPIREGVRVEALTPGSSQGFRLETSDGPIDTDTVVVCTGAYQKPYRPPVAADVPASVLVIDAEDYANPSSVPDGTVLIVGSGQTGVQLAEELHLAGREVVLSCGRAPWVPRRLGDRDIVTWVQGTPFLDQPVASLPSPAARFVSNFQTTGARGGHDLHYRVLQGMGVRLVGRLAGISGGKALFADDLADSVAFGDARYVEVRNLLTATYGSELPEMPDPEPFTADAPTEIDLGNVGAVVFTSGFRPDYTRWVHAPVFDEMGFPVVDADLSTTVPGLYFCGVHFLRKRRSSLLFGVGEDANILAATIAGRLHA